MRTLLILAAFAIGVHAQTTARDYFDQGVNAYRSGNYPEAAARFKAALALDSTLRGARLYLATAYLQQFVPGAETPENREHATAAIREFRTVLQTDPDNLVAVQSLAGAYYNLRDFRSAEEFNRLALAIDPNNVEACYTLGVIPWMEFIGPDREARNAGRMKPEDPPPLKDAVEREVLKAKYWQSLTAGIDYEKRALAIDPEYRDAMSYLNLLIRYRADLDDTAEQAQADVKEADSWMAKALQAQKDRAARNPGNVQ